MYTFKYSTFESGDKYTLTEPSPKSMLNIHHLQKFLTALSIYFYDKKQLRSTLLTNF